MSRASAQGADSSSVFHVKHGRTPSIRWSHRRRPPRAPLASGSMARLHLFDLDGTLLQGTSAPVEISRQLGLDAETVALDQAISAGLKGPPEYAAQVYELWMELTEMHVGRLRVARGWSASGRSRGRSARWATTAPSYRRLAVGRGSVRCGAGFGRGQCGPSSVRSCDTLVHGRGSVGSL